MKRIAKVAVGCIAVVGFLAFLLLAPIVSMSEAPFVLSAQHGGCEGGPVYLTQPPNVQLFASISFAAFDHGLVYVPSGPYLWWLPWGTPEACA